MNLAARFWSYPTFHLRMQTEITKLLEEQGRVVGIRGNTSAGPVEIRADLVVGADGRDSLFENDRLMVEEIGVPTAYFRSVIRNASKTPERKSHLKVVAVVKSREQDHF